MTRTDFVDRLVRVVYHAAVQGTLEILEHVPGRRPSRSLAELSQWYHSLSEADQQHIRDIARLSARKAMFGMLVVLDHDRPLYGEDEERGLLELRLTYENVSVLLNDPRGEPLHDIFAALVPLASEVEHQEPETG